MEPGNTAITLYHINLLTSGPLSCCELVGIDVFLYNNSLVDLNESERIVLTIPFNYCTHQIFTNKKW